MTWFKRLFGLKAKRSLEGLTYEATSTLYSKDGRRSAEVRKFSNGETYLLEGEWVEGTTFKDRHGGRLVGPFASADHAEQFIVATPWFNGAEPQVDAGVDRNG
ncbi:MULTISPECIES: hypothetical protein, partial [unclassified Sphingomonas]